MIQTIGEAPDVAILTTEENFEQGYHDEGTFRPRISANAGSLKQVGTAGLLLDSAPQMRYLGANQDELTRTKYVQANQHEQGRFNHRETSVLRMSPSAFNRASAIFT